MPRAAITLVQLVDDGGPGAPCNPIAVLSSMPHTHQALQAKVLGAVEVPLFVKDDDMSPAGLLKQVWI